MIFLTRRHRIYTQKKWALSAHCDHRTSQNAHGVLRSVFCAHISSHVLTLNIFILALHTHNTVTTFSVLNTMFATVPDLVKCKTAPALPS